jgi:hypothetical protein
VWGGSAERSCKPMNKNRIEGAAEQGERARNREALVIKAKRRKSGGCAVKECVLTWGDLASWLKGRRGDTEREVSRGRSSCRQGAKGRRSRRGSAAVIDKGLSQMFAQAKLADTTNRVKLDESRQRETNVAEPVSRNLGHRVGRNTSPMTSTTSTARCGPACRVVWEGRGLMAAPYPDSSAQMTISACASGKVRYNFSNRRRPMLLVNTVL